MSEFVVQSMGKCGSRSVHKTLKYADYDVTHAHHIDLEDRFIKNTRYVISPIREPVRRNISAYFENYYKPYKMTMNKFIDKYIHHESLLWFDRHLKPVWGIDVYAEPFDKEQGWQIYEGEQVKLLVIRLEDFDKLDEAFTALTGYAPPELMYTNKTSDTPKARDYEYFLKLEVPAFYIEFVNRSKYVERFYT